VAVDIGIAKEIRAREHRVALTPSGVKALTGAGQRVFVEDGAGAEAGHSNADYESAGAAVAYSRMEVFARADLLLAVNAPEPTAYDLLHPGQTVMAFWMLPAARREDLGALIGKHISAVGLEAIQEDDGQAPVLTAMSEIAGRLAVVVGAGLLLNDFGGKGIVLSGAPGVPPAHVVVLGAGVLGCSAAQAAAGLGAEVLVLDRSVARLREALARVQRPLPSMLATPPNIERALGFADLVIAAPALRGQRAPLLITRRMLSQMRPRSVIMDLAIDMGGCCETSRPTSVDNPVYEAEGVRHFCVPNLPSTAARSATLALTNALLPHLLPALESGLHEVLASGDTPLGRGTYLMQGRCVSASLARLLGLAGAAPAFQA
jgi:alanine dehydrogenase